MQTPNSGEVTRPVATEAEVAAEAYKAKIKAEAEKWVRCLHPLIKSMLSGNEAKSV